MFGSGNFLDKNGFFEYSFKQMICELASALHGVVRNLKPCQGIVAFSCGLGM